MSENEFKWEQKKSFKIAEILNESFSVLEKILQKELESLENKAKLLHNLQTMKDMEDG